MLTPDVLFDLARFSHKDLFDDNEPVWAALQKLSNYLDNLPYNVEIPFELSNGTMTREHLIWYDGRLFSAQGCAIEFGDTLKGGLKIQKDGTILDGASLIMAGTVLLGNRIAIGSGVLIEAGAMIKSPTVIGDLTEVRQGAYLRGNCLIGRRCVVGHATEVKHSIFLDDAKAGHFAYLGDSIIGNNVNLGAGTKCANLRFIPGTVQISYQRTIYDTGLRKLGAILGDDVQTGCNSVTSPGTMMAKRTLLMPNATIGSGYHLQGKIR